MAGDEPQPPPGPVRTASKSRLWAGGRLVSKGRAAAPISPSNGLSVVEKYFYSQQTGKPQVIMAIWCRLHLPPGTPLSVTRLIEVIKLAAAEHYRLIAGIQPDSKTFQALGQTAAEFHPIVRVVERQNPKTWLSVLHGEVNTNFRMDDPSIPLWKIAMIVSPKVAQEYRASFGKKGGQEAQEVNVESPEITKAEGDGPVDLDKDQVPSTETQNNSNENNTNTAAVQGEYFEISFSFHHCLGDGLSMWAFGRTFLKYAKQEYFLAKDLELSRIPLSKEPPPILDNLMNPSLFEILPAVWGLITANLSKKRHRRFKGRRGSLLKESTPPGPAVTPAGEITALEATADVSDEDEEDVIGSYDPAAEPVQSIVDMSQITNATRLKPPPNARLTDIRFLFYDAEFVSALRKKSKHEGTTIAALLVVMALSSVRSAFADLPRYKTKKFPSRQGWVVTNSMRHLLPNSQLLNGADKQTDPSTSIFGGYAGSMQNANLKLKDKHDFWERCRTVRRGIMTSFRASLTRMKLANYLYRRPKLFNFLSSRVSLDKMSRQYSVELANLGAWDCPTAMMSSGPEDLRLRLDQFGGVINSSFDGARGLFSLGVITLSGNMSVMISYDKTSVSESDAALFTKTFDEGLRKVKDSIGKISIQQVRA